MRICVSGLWHLGAVTAACLASANNEVVGFDEDEKVVENLRRGDPPLFEPGLAELTLQGLRKGTLSFTSQAAEAVSGCDILWVAYDTPVDENDVADTQYVADRVRALLPLLPDGCLVLISSQLPVGSTRSLADEFRKQNPKRHLHFGYSPENLRLGNAIDVFTNPDRVIVGLEAGGDQAKVKAALEPFTSNVIFMSLESAEMTKHAINSFLAMSISFANEIAVICERVGADATEVARGLKSESRIGPHAYVAPGVAFSGGTLARDIGFLTELGDKSSLNLALLPSVRISNDRHRDWPLKRAEHLLGGLGGRRISLLGLTYKPGTDTLRRSYAIELARALIAAGAEVAAFDPTVNANTKISLSMRIAASATEAVSGADAVIIATEWPEFRDLNWPSLVCSMRRPVVIDPKGILPAETRRSGGITYASVGVTSKSEI